MTVAVEYFHAQRETTDGGVPGIHVAIGDFLKAWFRFGAQEKFICRAGDIHSYGRFKELACTAGLDPEARCIGLDPLTPRHNLETVSCLFRPDPALADMVWRRQQLSGNGYAACGLVHTLSGEQISRALADLLLAPTANSDALICPSASIRSAVLKLWDIQADYLKHRFGGSFRCPVQTPVIPIGIDTEKFAAFATPEKRQAQRQALGIAHDEIVILFVGRLSPATKAHPLPLFLAAEEAARRTQRKLHLVLYGYFLPQDMEPRFRELAKNFCRNVPCAFVTNGDPRFPDGLWASADIFASLADNIQESFGLTPVEAMACGLPAVVTDWDGYRDSLQHGREGFLIPTCAPPAEAGQELAGHYFNANNYGAYLAGAAQSTAVDIQAAAAACATLAENDAQRLAMGANGRKRAQAVYDWRVIIPAYEALWTDLAERRKKETPGTSVPAHWPAAHPAYPNPWAVFGGFPASTLSPDDGLRVVMTSGEISLILEHEMNLMIPELLPPVNLLRELIDAMRPAGLVRVKDVMASALLQDRPYLWRCLGWMLKHGICVREAA